VRVECTTVEQRVVVGAFLVILAVSHVSDVDAASHRRCLPESLNGVLEHFSIDRYELFVREAAQDAEFVPIGSDVVHPTQRFFLVARARRSMP